MRINMDKLDGSVWTPLKPIYAVIGISALTLKDIWNPNHVIYGLNHSRKKIKRR